MNRENVVFRMPDLELFVSANYYTQTEQSAYTGVELTLILACGRNAHKEQCEDTIAQALRKCSAASNSSPRPWRVRDAWALDALSYGHSSILDKSVSGSLSTSEYASVLRHLVTSKFVQGRNIVVIGHSEGASAWIMACAGATLPAIRAMIFIEPVLADPPIAQEDESITKDDINVFGVFASSDSAGDSLGTVSQALQKRPRWKLWDERVFDACLKHGFVESRNHATELVEIPAFPNVQGVGLYVSDERIVAGPGTLASDVCSRYAMHVVLGERPDSTEVAMKANTAPSGSPSAVLVSIVPGSKDVSLHENPEAVANAIVRVIQASRGMNVKAGRTTARL